MPVDKAQPTGRIRNELVKLLRERSRLTLTEVAHRASIDPSYLSRIESGHKPGTPSVALRIARALDVPFDVIYERNPSAPVELVVLEVPGAARVS